MSNVLTPDGVLFLGGAETVLGISNKFKPLDNQRGMYVLANRPENGMVLGDKAAATPAAPASAAAAR